VHKKVHLQCGRSSTPQLQLRLLTSIPSQYLSLAAQAEEVTAGEQLRQRLAASAAAALHIAACALCTVPVTVAGPAEALLQSPNAMIARTVDAALRRSIPASNSDVQQIQTKLEVCRMRHSTGRTVRKSMMRLEDSSVRTIYAHWWI